MFSSLMVALGFPDGSMGPKILSAIQFLQHTDPTGSKGRKVVITNAETLPLAVQGKGGTVITMK